MAIDKQLIYLSIILNNWNWNLFRSDFQASFLQQKTYHKEFFWNERLIEERYKASTMIDLKHENDTATLRTDGRKLNETRQVSFELGSM